MGTKRTLEFRQEAVRVALTSGLTRKQVSLNSYGCPRMTEELKELERKLGIHFQQVIACNHREGRIGRFLLGDVNITCQLIGGRYRLCLDA